MKHQLPTLYKVNKDGSFQTWTGYAEGDKYYFLYGKEGGKQVIKETTATSKNVGKINETTPAQQAILELEACISPKFDKGYRYTKKEAKEATGKLPMLAHDYLKRSHLIEYPCYVSRKLDGVRAFGYCEADKTYFASRTGKPFIELEGLQNQLKILSEVSGINLFDGELYIHGVPLQNIVGAVRKFKGLSTLLEYHIFDIPDRGKGYQARLNILKKLQHIVVEHSLDSIKIVLSVKVKSENEAREVMDSYLLEGYEGLMLRNIQGPYDYGNRSNHLQKWKDFKEMEVKISSVREDKNGEGVYYCETLDNKFVECKMKGTFLTRNFEACKENIGKWITLKYQALTVDGIPQFPVGVALRECDENGNPLI